MTAKEHQHQTSQTIVDYSIAMSKFFTNNALGGAGRRSTLSNVEMRPFIQNGSWDQSQPTRHKSPTSTTSKLIDLLKSGSSWDERSRFSRNRKEKKKVRDRFAVNIPNRLIFHLIIVFFLVPLVLGMMLLIRALFFGLKEDEQHPLHKKLPHSHTRGINHNNAADGFPVSNPSGDNGFIDTFDVGDDRIEKGDGISSPIDTRSEVINEEPLSDIYPTDGEEQVVDIQNEEDNGQIDEEADGEVDGGVHEEVDGEVHEEVDREFDREVDEQGVSVGQDANFESDPLNNEVEESSIDAEETLGEEHLNDTTEHQEAEDE